MLTGCYSFNFRRIIQFIRMGFPHNETLQPSGSSLRRHPFHLSWSATKPATPTVTISVDATTAPRKIFHASLKIPATAGDFVLYYPKWIPGEHAPDGPVVDLAGLKFSAAGKPLKWRRDLPDGFTLHIEVPAGVTEINAELDFLSRPLYLPRRILRWLLRH